MKTRPAFFAAAVLAVGLLLVAKTYWIETEPPTLTVTAPPGARVAPGHVVEARAEDSGLGISEVHGLLDGELVAHSRPQASRLTQPWRLRRTNRTRRLRGRATT